MCSSDGSSFPSDVWYHIVSFMDIIDLSSLCHTSTFLRSVGLYTFKQNPGVDTFCQTLEHVLDKATHSPGRRTGLSSSWDRNLIPTELNNKIVLELDRFSNREIIQWVLPCVRGLLQALTKKTLAMSREPEEMFLSFFTTNLLHKIQNNEISMDEAFNCFDLFVPFASHVWYLFYLEKPVINFGLSNGLHTIYEYFGLGKALRDRNSKIEQLSLTQDLNITGLFLQNVSALSLNPGIGNNPKLLQESRNLGNWIKLGFVFLLKKQERKFLIEAAHESFIHSTASKPDRSSHDLGGAIANLRNRRRIRYNSNDNTNNNTSDIYDRNTAGLGTEFEAPLPTVGGSHFGGTGTLNSLSYGRVAFTPNVNRTNSDVSFNCNSPFINDNFSSDGFTPILPKWRLQSKSFDDLLLPNDESFEGTFRVVTIKQSSFVHCRIIEKLGRMIWKYFQQISDCVLDSIVTSSTLHTVSGHFNVFTLKLMYKNPELCHKYCRDVTFKSIEVDVSDLPATALDLTKAQVSCLSPDCFLARRLKHLIININCLQSDSQNQLSVLNNLESLTLQSSTKISKTTFTVIFPLKHWCKLKTLIIKGSLHLNRPETLFNQLVDSPLTEIQLESKSCGFTGENDAMDIKPLVEFLESYLEVHQRPFDTICIDITSTTVKTFVDGYSSICNAHGQPGIKHLKVRGKVFDFLTMCCHKRNNRDKIMFDEIEFKGEITMLQLFAFLLLVPVKKVTVPVFQKQSFSIDYNALPTIAGVLAESPNITHLGLPIDLRNDTGFQTALMNLHKFQNKIGLKCLDILPSKPNNGQAQHNFDSANDQDPFLSGLDVNHFEEVELLNVKELLRQGCWAKALLELQSVQKPELSPSQRNLILSAITL